MSQIVTKGLANDSVIGPKIRLQNAQGLRARNAANSADIELLRLSSSDEMLFGPQLGRLQNAIVLPNNTALKCRNAASSSDLSLVSLNASDEILFGAQLARLQASLVLPTATALKSRNNANSADLSLISSNASDEILFGAQLARLQDALVVPNATFIKGRNAANSADVNIIELNASDIAQLGVDLTANGNKVTDAYLNLHSLATDPGSASAGDMYFNTTSNKFRAYDGTSWSDVGSGGGGANQALSNLTNPTAINQDFIFDTGSAVTIKTKNDSAATQALTVITGDSSATDSGATYIGTGSAASTGTSGGITIQTGATVDGASGEVSLVSGSASGNGNAGMISITSGGAAGSGTGGNIQLIAGTGGGGNGVIILNGASIQIQNGPLFNYAASGGYGSIPAPQQGFQYYESNFGKLMVYTGTGASSGWGQSGPFEWVTETFVLSSTDITNQYIDLAHYAKQTIFIVQGYSGPALEGASYDYSAGDSGSGTRLNFLNDYATGGVQALTAGMVVQVKYLW